MDKENKIKKPLVREYQMKTAIGQAMNVLVANDPAFVEMLAMSHNSKDYKKVYNRNLKKVIRRANNIVKLNNAACKILSDLSNENKLTYVVE